MRLTAVALAALSLLFLAGARASPAPEAEGAEWLFQLTAASATYSAQVLTLSGVSNQTLAFTDRPVRETGVLPTVDFITAATLPADGPEDNSFFADRPNAAFSCVGSPTNGAPAATGIRAVFVLETAHFSDDGASLSFEVRAGDARPNALD